MIPFATAKQEGMHSGRRRTLFERKPILLWRQLKDTVFLLVAWPTVERDPIGEPLHFEPEAFHQAPIDQRSPEEQALIGIDRQHPRIRSFTSRHVDPFLKCQQVPR